MTTSDAVRAELVLLWELLQETRRRRQAAEVMCRGVQALLVACDASGALSALVTFFSTFARAARCGGDLESAAAFDMAADATRACAVADVAVARERALYLAEPGGLG